MLIENKWDLCPKKDFPKVQHTNLPEYPMEGIEELMEAYEKTMHLPLERRTFDLRIRGAEQRLTSDSITYGGDSDLVTTINNIAGINNIVNASWVNSRPDMSREEVMERYGNELTPQQRDSINGIAGSSIMFPMRDEAGNPSPEQVESAWGKGLEAVGMWSQARRPIRYSGSIDPYIPNSETPPNLPTVTITTTRNGMEMLNNAVQEEANRSERVLLERRQIGRKKGERFA